MAPLLLTLAVLLPLAAAGELPAPFVVLGAALCLTGGRLRHHGGLGGRLLRIPLVIVSLAGLGVLLQRERPLGDLLIVAVVFGALLARRAGPRLNALGRALLLPLITLFIAPVPPTGQPLATLGRLVLVTVVVTVAGVVAALLLPAPRPSSRALRRAVRNSSSRRVSHAALELDEMLPPGAWEARLAVLRVEQAFADRADRGDRAADGEEVSMALDALETTLTTIIEDGEGPAGAPPQEAPVAPVSAARASVLTRLATQSAGAVALALVAGQLVFPEHWSWTVLTALTLTVGARSRGEVVLKGVQRLGGAVAGTTVSTMLAVTLGGHEALSVAVIVAVLLAGIVLRDVDYAYWAACITAVLGLLLGLVGGPSGVEVLGERLLAILVGSVCAVLPAFWLRPVRTHVIIRRRAADWLAGVKPLIGQTGSPEAGVSAVRAAESAAAQLREAVRPLALAGRVSARFAATRPELQWRDAALAGASDARRLALGDPEAAQPVRAAYRTIGLGLRATREA